MMFKKWSQGLIQEMKKNKQLEQEPKALQLPPPPPPIQEQLKELPKFKWEQKEPILSFHTNLPNTNTGNNTSVQVEIPAIFTEEEMREIENEENPESEPVFYEYNEDDFDNDNNEELQMNNNNSNSRGPTKPLADFKNSEQVNRPRHYNSGNIEVIDVIEDWKLGFHLGNAVKYIARAGKKDPKLVIQDLQKAMWYISRKIERLQNESEV